MTKNPDQRDDELIDLIARCAIRDQLALKKLYERVGPYLNGVAYRIVWHDELANEVLQEVFLQIWQNASSYRPDTASPLTWMTSIARYRALDRKDKEQRRLSNIPEASDDSLLESVADKDTPESGIMATQFDSGIKDCLSALNEKISQSIQLAYIHGYSREELAERFNTKANTVKSWLHRGSERLKQCLEAKINTAQ